MTDGTVVARLEARVTELEARVAELEAELRAARRAAHIDPLTGLLNRAGLAAAWIRHRPAGGRLALVDLDHFKPVNDRYGHATGDAVLVAVADQIRRLPLAARLGGDEFVALVGDGDELSVRVRVPTPDGGQVTVGASVGLAPVDVDDLLLVLARADAAMYRSKLTGRAEVFDPGRDARPVIPRPRKRLRDNSGDGRWQQEAERLVAGLFGSRRGR